MDPRAFLSLVTATALAGPTLAAPRVEGQGGGTTWFVDASVPGLGSGTANDPFRSVAYAVRQSWVQSGDEVLVAPGDYLNESIDFDGKDLVVRSTHGPAVTRLFAPAQVQQNEPWVVLRVDDGETDVVVEGFRITGGTGDFACTQFTTRVGGAVVVCDSRARIVDCDFAANEAELGGSIYIQDGTLELDDCLLRGPGTEARGEALYALRSQVRVAGCTFRDLYYVSPNTPRGGGAVALVESTAEISDSLFHDNATRFFGGHLWARLSDVTVRGCDFGLVTGYTGAAIAVSDGSLQMSDSVVRDARAVLAPGAGLFADEAAIRLVDCVFEDNRVLGTREGGALAVDGGIVAIDGSTFARNTAGSDGGAVHVISASVSIDRTIFLGNTTGGAGGAVYGRAVLDHCTLHRNSASSSGGGLAGGASIWRSIAWRNLPGDLVAGCVAVDSLIGQPVGAATMDTFAADPSFWSANDLHLLPGSPAIDAVTSRSELDPDGTRADLGAHPFIPRYCGPECELDLGRPGCASVANSTGARGALSAFGSDKLGDDRLVLLGTSLPPSTPTLLLGSRVAAVTTLSGSAGPLCVGSPILRFLGTLTSTRPDGSAPAHVPLSAMPSGVVANSGQTWVFQVWYRDAAGGDPSNTTDSVAVTLR